MHLQYVVGTIAGDDTVFVATESVDDAKALSATILDMTGSEHADKA
jgi:transcriptional regulator of arginine metabolism